MDLSQRAQGSKKKALQAAIEMQRVCRQYNGDKPDEEKVRLCVGLGYGRVLKIGDTDVFGAEVNAASKLGEDTARSREILVTEAVREAVLEMVDIDFEKIDAVPPGAGAAYRLIYH